MDVRGLTLRRKNKSSRRPQISAPKPVDATGFSGNNQQHASPPASHHVQVDKKHNKNKGAISDLVKRRYSTRFYQPGQESLQRAPPVPQIPSSKVAPPASHASPPHHAPPPNQTPAAPTGPSAPATKEQYPTDAKQLVRVDERVLANPDLQADKYVASLLADASDKEIDYYQHKLQAYRDKTSYSLQKNIYRNRDHFMKISMEAEKLKEEMITLRTLMSELALGQSSVASSTSPLSPSTDDDKPQPKRLGHPHRSSVANLENMWTLQLQALWKAIERSQKFLPATPGRHVILESGQWVELHAATWKPKRPAHLVLLNDHMLVATKKKKRVDPNQPHSGPVPTKLVAQECWALLDIEMIDLSESGSYAPNRELANAIDIRYGSKSYTYRADSRSTVSKNDMLLAFRKALEELKRNQRIETETTIQKSQDKRASHRMSIVLPEFLAEAQPPELKNDDNVVVFPQDVPGSKIDVVIYVDGRQENMRWVDGQLDDLDISIALQNFEAAVSTIERLRKLVGTIKSNVTGQNVIKGKINQRALILADMLTRALVDTHSFLGATQTKIDWLTRLEFEDRAREAYLRARSDVIGNRYKQCTFTDDTQLNIFQISYIYFTLIKNTISMFQRCFPITITSACIKWARDQIIDFNTHLAVQMADVNPGTPLWNECIAIVQDFTDTLAEEGVDFRDLAAEGLRGALGDDAIPVDGAA